MSTRFPSYEDRQRIEMEARALRAKVLRDGFRAMGRMISEGFDRLAHGFHRTA